jgi:hypothetical protein
MNCERTGGGSGIGSHHKDDNYDEQVVTTTSTRKDDETILQHEDKHQSEKLERVHTSQQCGSNSSYSSDNNKSYHGHYLDEEGHDSDDSYHEEYDEEENDYFEEYIDNYLETNIQEEIDRKLKEQLQNEINSMMGNLDNMEYNTDNDGNDRNQLALEKMIHKQILDENYAQHEENHDILWNSGELQHLSHNQRLWNDLAKKSEDEDIDVLFQNTNVPSSSLPGSSIVPRINNEDKEEKDNSLNRETSNGIQNRAHEKTTVKDIEKQIQKLLTLQNRV